MTVFYRLICTFKTVPVKFSFEIFTNIDSSAQFSRSVISNSFQPHELQHARPACPSPTPGVYPNSCPLSWWCHLTISSCVVPFSSCRQSFPASGSFQMSQPFASGGQSIGEWEKTYINHIYDNRFISRICEELLQLSNKKTNLLFKWPKYLNPSKEDIQIANKTLRRGSISLATRKMQNKTTVR